MQGAFVVRNWGSMLLKGLLALAFGIVLLAWPAVTVRVIIRVFGVFALVFGAIWLFAMFVEIRNREKWGLSLAMAAISIFVGILALARTYETAVVILYILVIWLLASGAIEMAAATWMPKEFKYRWLLAAEGILSIVVGFLLMLFPDSTARAIVFFIGLFSIAAGIMDITIAFLVRSYFKKAAGEEIVVEVE